MFGLSTTDINQLLEKIDPKHGLEDLVLPKEFEAHLSALADDLIYAENLRQAGLEPRKLVMLHGAPGCGKTSIAHAFAKMVHRPLRRVSFGALENAFVGVSEKNLESIFDFMSKNEAVVLIDEFDSLATARGQNRYKDDMVNILLQKMEDKGNQCMTFACTNLKNKIDSAVLRRFDLTLEVPIPGPEVLLAVAEKTIKGRYQVDPVDMVVGCKTPSDVARNCLQALREAALKEARKRGPIRKQAPAAQPSGVNASYAFGMGSEGMPRDPKSQYTINPL